MSATDPSAFGGHEALVSALRASPPLAPERLRQRVLEVAPSRPSRRLTLSRRRLVLVLVPAAAALAVGAALVHGFVGSGSQSVDGLHGALATANTPSKSVRELAPIHRSAAPATTLQTADSAALAPNAPVIPQNRLVHADATLQVQVADRAALSQATNRATQIVASVGGYAQSVQYRSSHRGGGSSFLALRVPVGKAQAAIARLESLGTLLSQELSTQDLQQQLTKQTSRIGSLRRAIAVYEQALQGGSLSPSQRVEMQIRLANAQHALTQLRKARHGTVASGATADISLTLTTKQHGAVVPAPRSRVDRMLGSAAGFLALEGMVVLYALVVLSPALLLGGLTWTILRERRRRDEKRLLAST